MDINSQIKQGISQSQSGAAFGVSPIPFHKHTGADSPKIKQSDLSNDQFVVYSGSVTASGASGTPFPRGWTSSYSAGASHYTVTHNLASLNYAVVGTVVNLVNLNQPYTVFIDSKGLNSFSMQVHLYNSAFATLPFDFVLILSK